uniref:Uncharacterized protein n=1 Tax=Stomoxys calcitrans TaxID=35570 RepID=A0A1I8PPV2_STOCA
MVNMLWVLQKTRCLNPPRTARKVETYIKECQDEVRNKLVQEAYSILKHEVYNVQPPVDPHDDKVELIDTIHAISTLDHGESSLDDGDYDDHNLDETNHNHYEYITLEEGEDVDTPRKRMARLVKRIARVDDISNGIYHPTLVPFEDKRIAGHHARRYQTLWLSPVEPPRNVVPEYSQGIGGGETPPKTELAVRQDRPVIESFSDTLKHEKLKKLAQLREQADRSVTIAPRWVLPRLKDGDGNGPLPRRRGITQIEAMVK